MYKIIVCDLDETLLDTANKKVSAKNREAIGRAIASGVSFVIGTGRPYSTVQGTLEEIGLRDKRDQYVISLNGGTITENKDNRLLYYEGIDYEEASGLFERAKGYNVGVHVYTQEDVYIWNFDNFGERPFLTGRMPVIERDDKDLSFLKGEGIVKLLYFNTDFSYLKKIEADLSDITGNMDVSFSSNRYIEFNRKGVNKGAGLKRLCDILGVDIADTIAIGDNFNDLSMIRAAGVGVGVSNSAEGILPYCDYVTEADCNHDAVAEVIDRFIFS